MTEDRRERLIEAYLQGRATASEIREIDALVRSDPRFPATLAAAANDEAALEHLCGHRVPFAAGMTAGRVMRGGLLAAVVGVVVVAGGWLWLAGRPQPLIGCQVVETRGSVLLLARDPGDEATPLEAGDVVDTDGRIRTGPWAAVALRLANGTRLQIDRASEATLANGSRTRVNLIKGTVFVTRDRNAVGSVVLTTPQASIELISSVASVVVDDARTVVEVAAGETTLMTTGDGTTQIAAGQVVIVERGDGGAVLVRQGRLTWQLPDAAVDPGPAAEPGS
jgi:ferric-dicitrate binding protein FerR (iron transport regulator)